MSAIKTITLGLVASSLLLTACGNKNEQAGFPEAPDAAVKAVLNGVVAGEGGVLWQALPTGYQTDINDLAQLMSTKLDAELYDKTFALLGRFGGVVEKQQAFIFGSSKLPAGEENLEQMKQAVPALVGILQTLANSPTATVAGLQDFDGSVFFETTVSELITHILVLSELSEDEDFSVQMLEQTQVKVIEQTETTATLELSVPNQPAETSQFVKVENRWLPVEMSAEWAEGVAKMKAQLEGLTVEEMAAQKPQIMGVLTMLDGVLSQLESAETQEQFDQALQGAMMPLFGLLMMSQQQMNAAPLPANPSAPTAPVAPAP